MARAAPMDDSLRAGGTGHQRAPNGDGAHHPTTLVFDGAAAPHFHLPDPDRFCAQAWSPAGIMDPNERHDEGLSGQVPDGFGTTAGLIVAKYPQDGHEVGARVDPQVLIFDRVQQMDVSVHPPPL